MATTNLAPQSVQKPLSDPDGTESVSVLYQGMMFTVGPSFASMMAAKRKKSRTGAVSPLATVSLDGTRVPPAESIVTPRGVFTLQDVGGGIHRVLLEGTWYNGGTGDQLLWDEGLIYVHSENGNWYRDDITQWTNVGPNDPEVTEIPDTLCVYIDGIAFLPGDERTTGVVKFVLTKGKCYWYNTDKPADWYYYVPHKEVAYHGTTDPRGETPPPVVEGMFKELRTTCKVQSGTNVLTGIPSAALRSMRVNEWYIGEIPTYMDRNWGRAGLYNQFPWQSVKNWGAFNSMNPSDYAIGTLWWVRESDGTLDAGDVVQRVDPAWGLPFYAYKWFPIMYNWWWARVLPRSLHFRVGKIIGDGVEMVDRDGKPMLATASADNIALIHNNAPILQDKLAQNANFAMDKPGLYAAAGLVEFSGKHRISGLSKAGSGFYSPKGVRPFELKPYQAPGTIIETIDLGSNEGDDYFMTRLADEGWKKTSDGVWDSSAQGGNYPYLIHNVQSEDFTVQDCSLRECPQMINSIYADNVRYLRNDFITSTRERNYSGWLALMSDLTRGGVFKGNKFINKYFRSGFDFFKSKGLEADDNDMGNCITAMNTSGQWKVTRHRMRTTKDCSPPQTFASCHQPIFNGNTNQGQTDYNKLGGVLTDFSVVQEGYARNNCCTFQSVLVQHGCENVEVSHGHIETPDYNKDVEGPAGAADDSQYHYPSGNRAILHQGINARVGNITCKGTSPQYEYYDRKYEANVTLPGIGPLTGASNPFIGPVTGDPKSVERHKEESVYWWP